MLGLFAALLGACLALGLAVGAVDVGIGRALGQLLTGSGDAAPTGLDVLVSVRLPRVLLGALVGAALAVSGVAMQGLLRNPLADAGLLGVSSGAALAAALVIVLLGPLLALAPPFIAGVALPLGAFVGGGVTATLVLRLGQLGGRGAVVTMLLAGIGINALGGAGLGLLTYLASDSELRDLTFWTLGSLAFSSFGGLAIGAVPMLAAIIGIALSARSLDLVALGEREALHLGVDPERVAKRVVLLVALGVGGAVAASGLVAFVGLVVPHVVRLALGPRHGPLTVGSALIGGAALVAADALARSLIAPEELPLGVLTAAVGAPVFLVLLVKQQTATREP